MSDLNGFIEVALAVGRFGKEPVYTSVPAFPDCFFENGDIRLDFILSL